MLARRTGQTVSGAAAQLEAARKLNDHPKTDAAARKGALSPQQTAAITDAASADPRAEDALLEMAERASLGELRDEAARRKAAAEDQEAKHRRIHDERHVRSWTGPDGAWKLSAQGPPECGARFMARMQPIADEISSDVIGNVTAVLNPKAATKIMLHVHHHGIGECGVFTYEIAETKVTQVMDFSRKHQHPLQCVMEKK